MAKKIIELHNGRTKRTNNRIGGDTSTLETRHRRSDYEFGMHKLLRQNDIDTRKAIEECDMIGPRGTINKNSSDYPVSESQEPRRNQGKRRNSRRRNSNNNQSHAQHFAAPITMVTTVVVKPKRPPIKVIIDEGGTMRAIPLV